MHQVEYRKLDFTEDDIRHLAQAFDILLEGAIQNHLIDEHGKLVGGKASLNNEKKVGESQ